MLGLKSCVRKVFGNKNCLNFYEILMKVNMLHTVIFKKSLNYGEKNSREMRNYQK